MEPYQDLVGAEGGFIYGKLIEAPIFKPGMTAPDPGLEETIREINGWVSKNENCFSGTRNALKVGLFWSQETANTYGGEVPESDFTGKTITVERDYMKSFQGAYEMLQRSHIPFKIVDDMAQIDELELLILPNCACLSSEEVTHLERYMRAGGRLICSFETSLYSGTTRRADFLLISELLGIRYRGIENYEAYENYFQIGEEFFPAYTYVLKVEPTTAETLGFLYENTKGSYQPLRKSPFPALCRNDFDNGKIYYFAGNFFQTYYDYKFPKHLQLFERIFDSLIQREIILENTPRSVEVSLREKGDRLFVHLINFSCELKRPIESVIPLQDIVVKIPEIRAAKVRPLIEKNQISWQVEDGFLKVTLPLLKEYEILEIWRERK